MFSFFGNNRRRQAQPVFAPPPPQNAFVFAPPAPPDPPRRRLPKKLPQKILNHAQSVHHARVRCKSLRRIFREKLEGSLCDLPKQEDMEKEALKEADKEIFFHVRKELFEEVLDLPEPVMRTIFDFQDPQIDLNIVPDLTSEAMSFESEVHGELARMLRKTIKKLAKKTAKDNIDELRVKLQEPMRKLAISAFSFGNSVEIKCSKELDSLLAFNHTLTDKMFTSGVVDVLRQQWPEFGFSACIHPFRSEGHRSTVSIKLEPPRRRSHARLDDVIASFDPPKKNSEDPPRKKLNTNNSWREFLRADKTKPVQSMDSLLQMLSADSSDFEPCTKCCFCRFHNFKK